MEWSDKKTAQFIAIIGGVVFLLISCQNNERALVVGKIQEASDLVSTEYTIDKVVFGTKTKNILWVKFNESQFMAYSQAKIKTGIDLSKILEEDIIITGTKIQLRLPPVEVINFSYPPSSFVEDSLISDPNVFLNNINIHDQEEFFRMAELDIRNNLKYMGMVKATQDHTRKMFNMLLGGLGYEEIYITFKSDELIVSEVKLETSAEGLPPTTE